MYEEFQDMRVVTNTQTNVRLFLKSPQSDDYNFKDYVTVILEGTMEVFTRKVVRTVWGDGCPMYALPWDVGEMSSSGESSIGTIHMHGNPDILTVGVIRQNCEKEPYPATLDAAVYQILELPGYGTFHNKYPVMIRGLVDTIPPFHTVAQCPPAPLYDDKDQMVGLIGGRALTIISKV